MRQPNLGRIKRSVTRILPGGIALLLNGVSVTKGNWKLSLHMTTAALVLLSSVAASRGAEGVTSTAAIPTLNYCGLYAVYGAAVHEGVPLEFVSLLQRKYMSCPRGSSMHELQLAAQDHGLYTLPMSGMTPRLLRQSAKPVVLYIRSDLSVPNYDHYVLFVRYGGDKYHCLDNDEMRSWSEAELLSRWSGSGMILSASEIPTGTIVAGGWLWSGCWLLGPLVTLLGGRQLSRRLRPKVIQLRSLASKPLFQLAGIVAASIAGALIYHRTAAAGLLAADNQVQAIQAAHVGNFIPKMSLAGARSAHLSKTATFVDARFASDYDEGHIDGAISVPINVNRNLRIAAMKAIPLSRPLIVYCQSKGCPFAGAVASMLIREGYANVSVFTDGWEGWRDNASK